MRSRAGAYRGGSTASPTAGRTALEAWLEEPDESYEVRDEGLLKLFFGDLMSDEQRLDLVRRRRAWYEESAAMFRRIGEELGELDETSGTVLRYGVELMEWDAAWWRDLERRLS